MPTHSRIAHFGWHAFLVGIECRVFVTSRFAEGGADDHVSGLATASLGRTVADDMPLLAGEDGC